MIEAGVTPDWIIDVSLARSKEQAIGQLMPLGPFDNSLMPDRYFNADAALGHLSIRYLHLQLSFREFLAEAGRVSYDSYDGGYEFFDLLERLDRGTPEATIFAELAPLFAPLVDEAERQWKELFPES